MITQEELIKEISEEEKINVIIVRQIFKSAEDKIFTHLSSTTPLENKTIKIFKGLSLEGEYIPQHVINKGIFHGHNCSEKIRVRANITNYYNKRINGGDAMTKESKGRGWEVSENRKSKRL